MIWWLVAAGLYPHSAAAYVLQGPHLLELMIAALGRSNELAVEQRLVLYGDGFPTGALELNQRVAYRFPDAYRCDTRTREGAFVYIASGPDVISISNGVIVSWRPSKYQRYKDLLLYRSRNLMQLQVSATGVDVTVSSLGRFEGRPAFVIGARYPDPDPSQIWLDKETFLPLRWLLQDTSPVGIQRSLEIRYLDWKKFQKSRYPRRIEYFRDGRLEREINVTSVDVNPVLPASAFDIEGLAASARPNSSDTPSQPATPNVPGEIKKAIEDFNKLYSR